jgi:GTP cyclohydrolase I
MCTEPVLIFGPYGLTQQALIAPQALLLTENVAISIDTIHYCVKSWSVMDANSRTQKRRSAEYSGNGTKYARNFLPEHLS